MVGQELKQKLVWIILHLLKTFYTSYKWKEKKKNVLDKNLKNTEFQMSERPEENVN